MLPHPPPNWGPAPPACADFFVGSGAFAFILVWKAESVGLAPNAPHAEDSFFGGPCLAAQPEVVPPAGMAGFSAAAEMTELPSLLGRRPGVFVLLVNAIQSPASGFSSGAKGFATAGAWLETGDLLSALPTGITGERAGVDLPEVVGVALEDELADPGWEAEIGGAPVLGDDRSSPGTENGELQAVELEEDAAVGSGPMPKPKPCPAPTHCDMSGADPSDSSFHVSAIAATKDACVAAAGTVGGEVACDPAFSAFFFFFSSFPPPAQNGENPLIGGEILLDPGVHSSSSDAFGGRSSSVIGVGTGAVAAAD